jgi:hypothetical protein
LVLEDVQAYTPVGVNIAMVDTGCEAHFRGLKRIVSREVDI